MKQSPNALPQMINQFRGSKMRRVERTRDIVEPVQYPRGVTIQYVFVMDH